MMTSGPEASRQTELLYINHHNWLYHWLFRKTGNSSDAADLAHDTFFSLISTRPQVFIEEPRAYLTTIAKRLLISRYRRAALETAYLDALALLPQGQHPSPEDTYLILETLHEINAMLDALPEKVRETFLLSQMEGLKYTEIAQKMNLSLITVKRYMQQAFLQCLVCIA